MRQIKDIPTMRPNHALSEGVPSGEADGISPVKERGAGCGFS